MKITTSKPGLVLLLIDGSHSTGVTWGNQGQLLSESIQKQTNRFILDLVINAVFDEGEIRDRIKLSAFIAQGDSLEWAFEVEETPEQWLSSELWANSGRKVEDSNVPVWIDFTPRGKTPLFAGWTKALGIVSNFKEQYPDSPVFMVTLTDGDFKELLGSKSDDEIDGMKQLLEDAKSDDNFIHLVVHLSPDNLEPLTFPTEAPEDKFGRFLFDASTWMPKIAFTNSTEAEQNRRAYVLNADAGNLSKALELGSKVIQNGEHSHGPTPLESMEEEEE